jgi:hypothetical protein
MNQSNKPTTVPYTSRQRLVTRSGAVLERAYVFLPAATWEALTRLCASQHRSGSQIIENLINLADSGTHKDNYDDTRTRTK